MAKQALIIGLRGHEDYTVHYNEEESMFIFTGPYEFALSLEDAQEMIALSKEKDEASHLWTWIDTHQQLLQAIQVSLERLEEEITTLKRMENPNDIKDYVDNRISYVKDTVRILNNTANHLEQRLNSNMAFREGEPT